MQRVLPALVAIILLIAGIAALVSAFSSHDAASIGTTATVKAPAAGPDGLPAGNIVIRYSSGSDGGTLRTLSSRLSAESTTAAVAAGQAIVLRHDGKVHGVVATNGRDTVTAASATAPAVGNFVQHWLGATQ